jgi:predicted  nucleic acid-binding Zn-ribbon protein
LELDYKIKQMAEADNKILSLNEIIERKDYQIKDMDQVFNTLKLKNEAAQAQIKGLEGEKAHLELSLNENRTMKDKFYERSEIKQREYQDLLEKFNIVQKDVVAINEIKRDRDERIKQLRDELEETTRRFDELSGCNSALVV